MTVENDAKSKEELTCGFKSDMGNLMNFEPSPHKKNKPCLNRVKPRICTF